MSSILKALQKLEQDRSVGKEHRELSRDILIPSPAYRKRKPGAGWVVALGLLALGAVGWALQAGSISAPAPVGGAAAKSVSGPRNAPLAPSTEAPSAQALPTAPPEPVRPEAKSAVKEPTRPATVVPAIAVPPDTLPPELVVSFIEFSPDPVNRLAVVNGLPVMEQTVIEGAEVEEILADRVRFLIDGQPVEIFLVREPSSP